MASPPVKMLRGNGGLKDKDSSAVSSREVESTPARGADRRAAAWLPELDGKQAESEQHTSNPSLHILIFECEGP